MLVSTESGFELLAAAHARRQAAFDAAMVGWSERERAEFARLLTRFVAGMS